MAEPACYVESYLSVAIFLAGVTSARLGLWILDLAINQVNTGSFNGFLG
jgi:hypothetical protein